MANDAYSQQALAADSRFRQRLSAALAKVAWQVFSEDPGTPDHAARVTFARAVIASVDTMAIRIAPWFVMRTNVFAFPTTYDFPSTAVVTASGDPDIESQLSADWNVLSGV